MVTFSKKLSAALLFGAMTFTALANSLGVSVTDNVVVEEQVEKNDESNENNEDGLF